MTDTIETPTSAPTTGYQVVIHPSRIVRPVPAFVFAAPDSWVVDEAPGAVLAVRASAPVNDFWDNALLTHDRVAKAVDLQAAATASWGRLKADAPSAEVKMERVARFGDNIVYLRGVQLAAPRSGRPLAQLHALFFAPLAEDRATSDLFQVIATSPADVMGRIGAGLVEMIASFRFV
jgi:hypothetical protein